MVKIHLLNVGKGSSTWIDFGDRLGVIDIDDSRAQSDASLTNPLDFYREEFAGRPIFRFILSHPDMDHLSGLDELARTATIANFWDTNNTKRITEFVAPYREADWHRYQLLRRSESSPKCLRLRRFATADCCWEKDGLSVLAPTEALEQQANDTEEFNHISYVIRQQYLDTIVLHGGDASPSVWASIYDEVGPSWLKANILVAPHHGSDTCVHEKALEAVDPEWVLVSVAEEADYDEEFYGRIARKGVLTTRDNGDIRAELYSGGGYELFVDRL